MAPSICCPWLVARIAASLGSALSRKASTCSTLVARSGRRELRAVGRRPRQWGSPDPVEGVANSFDEGVDLRWVIALPPAGQNVVESAHAADSARMTPLSSGTKDLTAESRRRATDEDEPSDLVRPDFDVVELRGPEPLTFSLRRLRTTARAGVRRRPGRCRRCTVSAWTSSRGDGAKAVDHECCLLRCAACGATPHRACIAG